MLSLDSRPSVSSLPARGFDRKILGVATGRLAPLFHFAQIAKNRAYKYKDK